MRRITEYDAVALGSGACSLAAAVTLAEGGAKVAVFEKQPTVGGASVNFREPSQWKARCSEKDTLSTAGMRPLRTS